MSRYSGQINSMHRRDCPESKLWINWAAKQKPETPAWRWSFWRMEWEPVVLKKKGDGDRWMVETTYGKYGESSYESEAFYRLRPKWLPESALGLTK